VPSKQELIKKVSNDIGWTQADIKRAIANCKFDANSGEKIWACCMEYAGSESKKRNREIGGLKGRNKKQKEIIEKLINQLSKQQDFYTKILDFMKLTNREQANYIKKLLRNAKDYIQRFST